MTVLDSDADDSSADEQVSESRKRVAPAAGKDNASKIARRENASDLSDGNPQNKKENPEKINQYL